jgi:uncharacterized protein (UPF0333 family)
VQVKRKTPRGIWVLRGITVAIVLVVLLVIGTVAYSAYEDYSAVRAELAGGSKQVVGTVMTNGSSETVSINIPVPNGGLYPLNVTLTCNYPTSNVVCQRASVNVLPGGEEVLQFKMTVSNVSQFESSADRVINGTVAISMTPFVGLTVGTDFGGFVKSGGG